MKLYCCDCLEISVEKAELVYLDPPYGPKGEDMYYGVGKTINEYVEYVTKRISHLVEKLTDYNLIVHVDPKCGHYIKVALDQLIGRDNFRNEIVWCYSGPAVPKTHMPRKHDCLYWYGVGKYVFNPQRIPYQAKLSVGGKTSWAGETKDRKEYEKKGKLLEDHWSDIASLCRNEKNEKRGYATQKPLALMRRIVASWSNPGGMVVDAMVGSGTTGIAAVEMGRDFIGCDLSPEAIEKTQKAIDKLMEKQ